MLAKLRPLSFKATSTSWTFLLARSYSKISRNSRYSVVTDKHCQDLKQIIADDSANPGQILLNSEEDLSSYNIDWTNKFKGDSKVVLKPRSTEQVSKILKYCNEQNLAILPQGGNTGLVGGQVPVFDEIILNLSLLNKIYSFDEDTGVLTCQAGCVLENLDNYVRERNHIIPLDLGAKGSCFIGGNVATAAGGLRLLRYGSLQGSVIGLETVLANGTILDLMSQLRKDNTGLHLKNLFIGSEGVLGVITGVSILCPPKPKSVNVAFLGCNSFESAISIYKKAKQDLNEILSAFELMDKKSLEHVNNHFDLARPTEEEHPFYCLIETSGSNEDHDLEKLNSFLERLFEDSLIEDGVIAQDEAQKKNLFACRENIPEALSKFGSVFKYDISLPLNNLYDIVHAARDRFREHKLLDGCAEDSPVLDVIGYGHVGDGNLHLNVVAKSFDKRIDSCLQPWIYEWIQEHRGSISAEHGVGLLKQQYLQYSKSKEAIEVMQTLKNTLDPNHILSPYKCIPTKKL